MCYLSLYLYCYGESGLPAHACHFDLDPMIEVTKVTKTLQTSQNKLHPGSKTYPFHATHSMLTTRGSSHTMLRSQHSPGWSVSTAQAVTARAIRQQLQRARRSCHAVGKQQAGQQQAGQQGWRLPSLQGLASFAASFTLLLQPAGAGELSMAFPASANPEIRAAQKTLVEAWGGFFATHERGSQVTHPVADTLC